MRLFGLIWIVNQTKCSTLTNRDGNDRVTHNIINSQQVLHDNDSITIQWFWDNRYNAR